MFGRYPCGEEGYRTVDPESFFDAGVEERKAAEVIECGLVTACEDGEDFFACGRLVFWVLSEVIHCCR